MRTGNPTLTDKAFTQEGADFGETMTLNGTVNKTFLLLLLTAGSAYFTWDMYMEDGNTIVWVAVGSIGALIVGLIASFFKKSTPITAPIYAILQGLALGGISASSEAEFPGIVLNAVLLTFGTLLALLLAYRSGLIRATENFKLGLVSCTFGICLVYIIDLVLRLFGKEVPYIHGSGTLGIIVSLVIVVIAALNLVLDFDFIESGAQQGAPKYMEWYGAFGLMVTLVWLYIEVLRLLSKIGKR
jgi:uncharacterized YccA/Bax inhibitor family protein